MSDDHYLRTELYELVKRDPSIFDFLQEGSLDGIWYWDLERPEVEWMSPRFWTLFGYDPATKRHRADEWQAMIHPEDGARALDNFQRHLADPEHPYDQVVRYTHADGSTVWVRCRGMAVRNADGEAIRMLGAHTDVTQLKRAEELASHRAELAQATALELRRALDELELAKSELVARDARQAEALERAHADLAFGAAIASSSDDAIIGLDADNCVRSRNDAAKRLFGLTEAFAVGQPAIRLLDPKDSWGLRDAIAAVEQTGETTRIEHAQIDTLTHMHLDLAVTVSPILSASGRSLGTAIVARDISEQLATNRALRERAEALDQSNKELEQFAYVASHDLKEPLRMVANFVDLLASRYEDALDETAQRYIRFASDGAKRMHTLLEDLLKFSLVGREAHPTTPVALADAVKDARAQLGPRAQGANIVVGDLPTVLGHPTQFTRIFQNLIGNALKFNADTPLIHISSRLEDGEWTVCVADNGVGFDPAHTERIFDIFQRLNARDAYPGNGIGLTIVAKLVRQLGGRCWADGTPGKGASFYFTVPAVHLPS